MKELQLDGYFLVVATGIFHYLGNYSSIDKKHFHSPLSHDLFDLLTDCCHCPLVYRMSNHKPQIGIQEYRDGKLKYAYFYLFLNYEYYRDKR